MQFVTLVARRTNRSVIDPGLLTGNSAWAKCQVRMKGSAFRKAAEVNGPNIAGSESWNLGLGGGGRRIQRLNVFQLMIIYTILKKPNTVNKHGSTRYIPRFCQ